MRMHGREGREHPDRVTLITETGRAVTGAKGMTVEAHASIADAGGDAAEVAGADHWGWRIF
ncbi:MAG: hypothetical protein H5U13_12805 [Parvibaculum sp.]|nr:hypothetical protein [Parvibaculum sp.]